jgi:glycosyltransferase involved in cell wall biosynthesis
MTGTTPRPALAIVIPHFNRAELLAETLQSVHSQTLQNWEVIVVDDGSHPEQFARVQSYVSERIRVLQRTDGPKGPSRCRNIGWKAAKAPLVMFLDSDDLLAPWALEERYGIFENADADAAVFPVMLFRKRPGDLNRLWNQIDGPDDIQRFLTSDPPWHTSSTLWRRDSLQRLGGFNEQLIYGDDADLHLRALLRCFKFQKCPETHPHVFIRRADAERITNTISEQLLESRLIRLDEGTALVRQYGNKEQQLAWQGQYFVECEFLLFNVADSSSRIKQTLQHWRTLWNPHLYHAVIAEAYLAWSAFFVRRCYLLLRIARRLSMLLLPTPFFPRGGRFEREQLSPELWRALMKRLHYDHANGC